MKKTVKNLFKSQTQDVKLLRDFMFAKDYEKYIYKYSESIDNAIDVTMQIGRKSVKTATVLASAAGVMIGGLLGTVLE
jgi:3-phosphoglycerate kinase